MDGVDYGDDRKQMPHDPQFDRLILWPELSFAPVNLWTVSPARFLDEKPNGIDVRSNVLKSF